MTTTLCRMRCSYGEDIGVELYFAFPDISDNEKTYLDADSAASVSTLSASGINFSNGQYIVIGQPGNEKTEILQISGTPSSTSINLVSPTTFPHNRGDIIRFIPYNQISAEFSTDQVVYTAITPVAIRADSSETYMQRATDLSTYSYKFRFYNSTSALYSSYSAIVLATGFADNTIGAIKKRALDQLGEEIGTLITDKFLNDALQEGRRMADQNPAVFRWSFRTKFGVNIGQLKTGQWKMNAPTDLRDRNTYKNILGIRIGKQNRPCVYQDRVRFNQNYLNIANTTLATVANFGDNTLTLTNSGDFLAPSGSVSVSGQTLADATLHIVKYTGNDYQGNLTGVTGIPAGGLAAGSEVWQTAVFGLPTAYTIDNGIISFDVPLIWTYTGSNVHLDYYLDIPAISSDSDVFDEPFYDLYVPWLKYKIKYKKANGKIDRDGDTDYKDWITGLGNLIGQQTPGQRISFIPDIEGFLSATE
jgi:hypothetical protein